MYQKQCVENKGIKTTVIETIGIEATGNKIKKY